MKLYKIIIKALFCCVLTTAAFAKTKEIKSKIEPLGKDDIAYKWEEIALTATANDTDRFRPRQTVTSRFLGL